MFTGKICVCSCVRFRFLSLTPLLTLTNLPCCDKRCDFKSKPIQLPPLPPIVDPQVGSATKLPWQFPVLANIHLSQHILQTSFSNGPITCKPPILPIWTSQLSPLQALKYIRLTSLPPQESLRATPASHVYWATILRYWELQTNTTISVKKWSKPITTAVHWFHPL